VQVRVQLFADEAGKTRQPAELVRMNETMLQTIAVMMRTFSIAHVEMNANPTGFFPACDMAFKPLDDEKLPAPLKAIRGSILSGVIRTLFERFGIQALTINLPAEELNELRTYWDFLQTGKEETLEKLKFQRVPLEFETDPTQDAVVPTTIAAQLTIPEEGTHPELPPPT